MTPVPARGSAPRSRNARLGAALMALPFFVVVARWERTTPGPRPGVGDRAALIGLGVMGYYLASLLDFIGLESIPAGLERLILFLYPTIVVVLTALLYRRPIGVPQGWALLLSYAGILLMSLARR